MNSSWVYILKQDDEVVYVGQTSLKNGVHVRVSSHKKDKVFNSVSSIEVSKEEMMRLETDLIIKHMPKYNKKINTVDLYKTVPWIVNNITNNLSRQIKNAITESIQYSEGYVNGMVKVGEYEYCDKDNSLLIIKSLTEGDFAENLLSNIANELNRDLSTQETKKD